MDYYYPVTSNTYTVFSMPTPTISWTTSTTTSTSYNTYFNNATKKQLKELYDWIANPKKEPQISEDDLISLIEGDE